MIELVPRQPIERLLLVGAHSDDIEIGAGGTVLSLVRQNPGITVHWVVLATHGERRVEAASSAERFLDGAGVRDVRLESFEERYMPYQRGIKEYFDALGSEVDPDLIICPWTGDMHQDHRTSAELVLNTFRNHLVLQYEIVKTDGDLGRPQAFVALDEELVEEKVANLMDLFPSQSHRGWFDAALFRAIMRIRGVESRSESGFAEGFHVSQMVIGA